MGKSNSSRSCGGCTACCSAIAIDDPRLKKPRWSACIHQRPSGCSIHPTKPRACTTYNCAWLTSEIGTEGQRPDRVGLVPAWGRRESSTAPETLVLVAVQQRGSCTAPARALIEQALDAGLLVHVYDRGLMPRLVIHAKRGTASESLGMKKQNAGHSIVWHKGGALLDQITKSSRAT